MPSLAPEDGRLLFDDGAFHFLPSTTTKERSRRDIELAHSSAKSHLAKLSHRRRNQETRSPSTLTGISSLSCSSASRLSRANIVHNSDAVYQSQYGNADKDGIEPTAKPLNGSIPPRRLTCRQSGDHPKSLSRSRSSMTLGKAPSLLTRTRKSDLRGTSSSSLSLSRPLTWARVSDKLSNAHSVRLLQYCFTTLWPGYYPGNKIDCLRTPAFVSSWAAVDAQAPMLVHSLLWHSAVHLSVKRRVPITEYESIQHHHRAVQCVSQELQKPINAINESVVFALVTLCTPEPHLQEHFASPKSEHQSLFSDLHWLSIHTEQPFIDSHIAGLYQLVDLRGGIDSLRTPGYAGAVQFTDIIQSTFRLCPPHFPVARSLRVLELECDRSNYFGLGSIGDNTLPPHDAGVAFNAAVEELKRHELSNAVREALLDTRVWTLLLQMYEDNTILPLNLSLLATRRNLIQHKLLCTILPARSDASGSLMNRASDTDGSRRSVVTRLVRIALLIFSITVTFPIVDTRLHQNLAEQLKAELTQDLATLLDRHLYCLLIWLGALGCVAAMKTSDDVLRRYFVDILYRAEKTRMSTAARNFQGNLCMRCEGHTSTTDLPRPSWWESVEQTCLTPFLWHDAACDSVTKSIWAEVQSRIESTRSS